MTKKRKLVFSAKKCHKFEKLNGCFNLTFKANNYMVGKIIEIWSKLAKCVKLHITLHLKIVRAFFFSKKGENLIRNCTFILI